MILPSSHDLNSMIDGYLLKVCSGDECLNWTIPQKWTVNEAWIKNSKEKLLWMFYSTSTAYDLFQFIQGYTF